MSGWTAVVVSRSKSRDTADLGWPDECSIFRRVAGCNWIRSAPNRWSFKTFIRHAIANA
jgi:hypothetical protein